jgi:oligopeptidase A
MNPLLNFTTLPQFKLFTSNAVAPAISQLIAEAEASISAVLNESASPTWNNVVTPIDDVTEKISRAWGMVSHLNAVNNSPQLREVYNALLPTVTQFWTRKIRCLIMRFATSDLAVRSCPQIKKIASKQYKRASPP